MDRPRIGYLQFEIKNNFPVSAEDYANSLLGIADEYRQFMSLHCSSIETDESTLLVRSVKEGSILSTLGPAISGTLPLIGSVQTVFDYAEYLAALVGWAQGKLLRPAIADEKKTMKNVVSIVAPTVKDQGAQLNIGTMNFHGDVNISLSLGSQDAAVVSAFARGRLDKMKETKSAGLYENVLLYWFQTRNAINNKAGDRARIDSISAEPVSVRFANEDLKRAMVLEADSPYQHGYIVDVDVMTVDGKPAVYLVERLIDIIELP